MMTIDQHPADKAITDRAKAAAGYGTEDTPGQPSRSSYTDDKAGDAAFARAVGRWAGYQAVLSVLVDTTALASLPARPR
jgi:hypothetical protein